jgi:hypothetical protein
MTARERAAVRRRPRLRDDPARTDVAGRDGKSEDAWVAKFISRLAGTLRDIGTMRRKEK